MEQKKQPQCYNCKHYIKNSSCGSCVSQATKQLQSILQENPNENKHQENNWIDTFKYSCRVVVNDPNDFEVVNPFNCKYFFSNSLKFGL
jgi:NAD(P)H-nitrite reductase large subunit